MNPNPGINLWCNPKTSTYVIRWNPITPDVYYVWLRVRVRVRVGVDKTRDAYYDEGEDKVVV